MNNYDDLSPTPICTSLKGVLVPSLSLMLKCFFNCVFHSLIQLYLKEFSLFWIHPVNYGYFPVTLAVDVVVQWCSQGDLLAVAGMERSPLSPDPACPPSNRNAIVKFYNVRGDHIYTLDTPAQVIGAVCITVLGIPPCWNKSCLINVMFWVFVSPNLPLIYFVWLDIYVLEDLKFH